MRWCLFFVRAMTKNCFFGCRMCQEGKREGNESLFERTRLFAPFNCPRMLGGKRVHVRMNMNPFLILSLCGRGVSQTQCMEANGQLRRALPQPVSGRAPFDSFVLFEIVPSIDPKRDYRENGPILGVPVIPLVPPPPPHSEQYLSLLLQDQDPHRNLSKVWKVARVVFALDCYFKG